MKKTLIAVLCAGIVIVACNKEKAAVTPAGQTNTTNHHYAARSYPDSTDTVTSTFIPTDVANAMINSYLISINSTSNDTDLKSFSVNADTLRAYLANSNVKNIKICFAHTMGYINAGYNGQNAGYQSGAITLIMVGYDVSGNYVYYNGKVLDHVVPCPYTCPPGPAGGAFLE